MRWLPLVWLVAGCDYFVSLDRREVPSDSPKAIDAAIDAAVFDPKECPGTYFELRPNGTRYRLTTAENFATASVECRADDPARTHLAVIGDSTEAFIVDMYLDQFAENYFYIGLVQDDNATTVAGGWRWVTGAPLDNPIWGNTEPNDGGNNLENGEENIAELSHFLSGDFVDAGGLEMKPGICECDGVPTP